MVSPSIQRQAADRASEGTPLLQDFEDHQSHILPRKQLLKVFPALALIHFTSFLDQTALSTSLPAIAAGLNTGSSISWVSASFLTTSTSIQLINGRLSDIFGRKTCLLGALAIMALGNLLSGFSQTPAQLYATRAFSGLGAGAINALVQISISDITTLEQRGYYFGILGVAVALGNGLGPVVGGVLTEYSSWRWAFWFVCPLAAVAATYFGLVFPSSGIVDNVWMKLRRVDWFGVCTSMLAIVLILIPVSQGGSAIPWNSPIVITMLTFGATLFAVFLMGEWRWVKLPLLPIQLLNKYPAGRKHLDWLGLLGQPFLYPAVLPERPWLSPWGGWFLNPTDGHRAWRDLGINWNHYVLDPSIQVLVGLLAGSDKSDRAVVTGLRNFIRDMGGSVGVTVSGAILNNVLQNVLRGRFSAELISKITSSAFSLSDFDLTDEDKKLISDAYMRGLRDVFTVFAVLIALYFVLTLCVKDYGLASKAEPPPAESEERLEEEPTDYGSE
ncbi:hypothetical protein ETB97_011924 [Aspergillus alliaceus]|uniref:Major facilitator superfamily (MFS) profile domain-containing protein n=1 Tax=Petromyces alliaceus TaxID=209559 RepID=A0A8H6A8P5_PETAA|nr:hypothetical protein ETB97_011924 [Aspergillus burnettii]